MYCIGRGVAAVTFQNHGSLPVGCEFRSSRPMLEGHSHGVTRECDDWLGPPWLGEPFPDFNQSDRPGSAVALDGVSFRVSYCGCLDDQCGCCIGHGRVSPLGVTDRFRIAYRQKSGDHVS